LVTFGAPGGAASSALGLRVSALIRNLFLGEQHKPFFMGCFSKVFYPSRQFRDLEGSLGRILVPLLLSFRTAFRTNPFVSSALGRVQNFLGSLPDPILINPCFSILVGDSRAVFVREMGASRAIGFPRSVINTSLPALTCFS